MAQELAFTKVEGAGNDYILIDVVGQEVGDPGALSRRLVDRQKGVGADGLILVGPATEDAAATMRVFNADGSEGMMCGNGLRCVVQWLAKKDRIEGGEVTIATASGLREGRIRSDGVVEVSIQEPSFVPQEIPVLAPAEAGQVVALPVPKGFQADPDRAFCVSVGNPHLVVRVPDPNAVDLARVGTAFQELPQLPKGANVQFTAVDALQGLRVCPWEQGSGATKACGTGAVAAVAVARRMGWLEKDVVRVEMPGGTLSVRWSGEGVAWLAGPANLSFAGVVGGA